MVCREASTFFIYRWSQASALGDVLLEATGLLLHGVHETMITAFQTTSPRILLHYSPKQCPWTHPLLHLVATPTTTPIITHRCPCASWIHWCLALAGSNSKGQKPGTCGGRGQGAWIWGACQVKVDTGGLSVRVWWARIVYSMLVAQA